jgi:hypothetical protein
MLTAAHHRPATSQRLAGHALYRIRTEEVAQARGEAGTVNGLLAATLSQAVNDLPELLALGASE